MATDQQLIERIQAQLSASAHQNFEAVPVPPFTVYINADSDSRWNNYAIPDVPVTGDVNATIDALCATFQARGRQPRFEFVDEFTPLLAPALERYGFVEEMRTQLMICTPATYRPVQASTHVHFAQLSHTGAVAPFQEFMRVQRAAFGHEPTEEVTVDEAEQFRTRFATIQFLGAWLPTAHASHTGADAKAASVANRAETLVSVASLLPPHGGITEIAGIATVQAYRRQGIAGALTAHVVAQAFAQGLTGVFLTAADANAGRVYERVGFQSIGTGVAYHLPTPS